MLNKDRQHCDQDKTWAPHKVCKSCTETSRLRTQGKIKAVQFGIPMVWRDPKNHHDDLFLHGLTCQAGISTRRSHGITPTLTLQFDR